MYRKAKFLVKEGVLRLKYMTEKDCIFCKIVKGEIKSKPIFENKDILAINDINPVAEIHVLIIPKNHIDSVLTVEVNDASDVVSMFSAAQEIVKDMKLEAFRLAFNGGRYQHVPHLHMHLLAGGSVKWERL